MHIHDGDTGASFSMVSGKGSLDVGKAFRLNPAVAAGTGALAVNNSDNEASLHGESSATQIGNGSSPRAVFTNAPGSTVTAVQICIEAARIPIAPDGRMITPCRNGSVGNRGGWRSRAEVQPGVTSRTGGSDDASGGEPAQASIFGAAGDPEDSGSLPGANIADRLWRGAARDTMIAVAGCDSANGGTGNG